MKRVVWLSATGNLPPEYEAQSLRFSSKDSDRFATGLFRPTGIPYSKVRLPWMTARSFHLIQVLAQR
ncbi:hypothetical protein [Dyadobacter helix]|uniref:hypothetical protein n=1 Tax=Dyadobacter helix TaxID=2822344 RepID=UPI001BFC3AC4|nr:hypothetical protein [Dyadobacter sp. CECT 9275]